MDYILASAICCIIRILIRTLPLKECDSFQLHHVDSVIRNAYSLDTNPDRDEFR